MLSRLRCADGQWAICKCNLLFVFFRTLVRVPPLNLVAVSSPRARSILHALFPTPTSPDPSRSITSRCDARLRTRCLPGHPRHLGFLIDCSYCEILQRGRQLPQWFLLLRQVDISSVCSTAWRWRPATARSAPTTSSLTSLFTTSRRRQTSGGSGLCECGEHRWSAPPMSVASGASSRMVMGLKRRLPTQCPRQATPARARSDLLPETNTCTSASCGPSCRHRHHFPAGAALRQHPSRHLIGEAPAQCAEHGGE